MGRLIDADKAIESMQYYHDDCAKTSEYTRLGFETAIEVVKDAPTIEAIPKADYEARLKADLKAILVELQLEIEEYKRDLSNKDITKDHEDFDHNNLIEVISGNIQQKIDKLKEVEQ